MEPLGKVQHQSIKPWWQQPKSDDITSYCSWLFSNQLRMYCERISSDVKHDFWTVLVVIKCATYSSIKFYWRRIFGPKLVNSKSEM